MTAWIGTLTSISGSFLVAFGILQMGYLMFLVGSISWLIIAVRRCDRALGVLNLVFLIANLIGLWRTL